MQRRAMLGIMAVFLTIGALLTLNSKLHVDSQSNQNSGFNWNNSWDNNNNPNPEQKPVQPDPEIRNEQIIASSYEEALKMSAEKGMAILVIFSGDSCSHCKRMKKEVLPNQKVKAMMKNYIYVMINTSERSGQQVASKFGLRYIPAFAIINSREVKLKFVENYMNVDQLVSWLNNPNMYNQPRDEVVPPPQRPQPPPQRIPERIPDRRPG